MTNDLPHQMMETAYARWAPIYDALCGPFFLKGRRAAAAAARRPGAKILELGVGTGLSFADYGPENEIFGVDISEPMILKAHERLATGAHPHVKEIRVMDAHSLDYPDASFDVVVAQFVITLVQDPERVLSECARVLKPGGEIILVNHFYSERGIAAAVERWSARYVNTIGLRPDFPVSRLLKWAESHGGIDFIGREPVKPLRMFTVVRFRRRADTEARAA
jgi:phosphatidylethanolamine/phosphatidyl-N-methylethanolamine N-methyltransferase